MPEFFSSHVFGAGDLDAGQDLHGFFHAAFPETLLLADAEPYGETYATIAHTAQTTCPPKPQTLKP